MAQITANQVVEIAQRYLQDKHPGGATLKVLPSGVTRNEAWWYIDVLPDVEPPKRFEYYEALADAEAEIEETENLTVFFQPVPIIEGDADKAA